MNDPEIIASTDNKYLKIEPVLNQLLFHSKNIISLTNISL